MALRNSLLLAAFLTANSCSILGFARPRQLEPTSPNLPQQTQSASPNLPQQTDALVSIGFAPTFYGGEICKRSSDLISCTNGFAAAGPELAAHAVVSGPWQLGGRAGAALELGNRGETASAEDNTIVARVFSRRIFNLAFQPRFQPDPGDGFWLGATLGAAHLQDVVTETDRTRIDQSQWTALLGAGSGYDFALEDAIVLSPGARVTWLPFSPSDNGFPEDGTTTYDNVFAVSLLLEARVRL